MLAEETLGVVVLVEEVVDVVVLELEDVVDDVDNEPQRRKQMMHALILVDPLPPPPLSANTIDGCSL